MRVSPYAELLDIARHDTHERFRQADNLARLHFTSLVNQDLVLGAFPFGSTQFNNYDPFSDYDIVVAVEDGSVDDETVNFRAMHKVASDIYNQTAVPLEVTCLTRTQITEGLHGLPDNMLDWLKEQRNQQPQNVIGADFLPHLRKRIDRESPFAFESVDKYISTTRYLLKKTWFQGVYYRPHDLLSVIFNVPHVAGRKILDSLQLNNIIPTGTMPDVHKQTIVSAVEKTFSDDTRLLDLYTSLATNANLYRDVFISQVPNLSADEYDQIIVATLDDTMPKTIELLRRLQEEYRRLGHESGIGHDVITTAYVECGTNVTLDEHELALINELRISQLESY